MTPERVARCECGTGSDRCPRRGIHEDGRWCDACWYGADNTDGAACLHSEVALMPAYTVGLGGSPSDSHISYETLEEAQTACLTMGREMADSEGVDPDSIVLWGDDAETGWGACPAGHSGAYWPQIVEVA